MTAWRAWLQASRPLSAVNLQLPLVFGHVLAYRFNDNNSWDHVLWLCFYGITMQLYIVFINDWADYSADLNNNNPTVFSGGSRVLVEGKLMPTVLLRAGSILGAIAFCWSFLYGAWASRVQLPFFSAMGLIIMWVYSMPPFRMNYRFGGEVLQAIGVGGLLPLIAFYTQTGSLIDSSLYDLWFTYFLLQLGAAVAFVLPDTKADNRSGKRTIAVIFGPCFAVIISFLMSAIGVLYLKLAGVYEDIVMVIGGTLVLILLSIIICWRQKLDSVLLTALLVFPSVFYVLVIVFHFTL